MQQIPSLFTARSTGRVFTRKFSRPRNSFAYILKTVACVCSIPYLVMST